MEQKKGLKERLTGVISDFFKSEGEKEVEDKTADEGFTLLVNCVHCQGKEHSLKFEKNEHYGAGTLAALCPESGYSILLPASGLKVNGKKLAAVMSKIIGERPDADIPALLAESTDDITIEQVEKFINGEIDFPPKSWLNNFARALDIEVMDLMIPLDIDTASFRQMENTNVEKEVPLDNEKILNALAKISALAVPREGEELTALLGLGDDEFLAHLSELKTNQVESKEETAIVNAEEDSTEDTAEVLRQHSEAEKVEVKPPATLKEWLETCPDRDFRDYSIRANEKHKEHRAGLLKRLVENGLNATAFKGMDTANLETLAAKVDPKPDYAVSSPRYSPGSEDPDAIPAPPSILGADSVLDNVN